MDVVSVGHLSMDRVKVAGKDKNQLGGGVVYSAMASKLFGRTGIVSRVGVDFPPRFLGRLKKAGIDIGGVKRVKGKSTSFSIEYEKDGTATYTDYSLNSGVFIRPQDIPPRYLRARAFHIAPLAPTKQKRFVQFLRDNFFGSISLNTHIAYFSKYRKTLFELPAIVDVFTLNDQEAMRLTDTRSLEHALNVLKKVKHNLIIVTMGTYGSIAIKDTEINFLPSLYQPEVVDLTGCGDAFAGAFASIYTDTGDVLKSANVANNVASLMATGWNFSAIEKLGFRSTEAFYEYVVSRQRGLGKRQRLIEHFF